VNVDLSDLARSTVTVSKDTVVKTSGSTEVLKF